MTALTLALEYNPRRRAMDAEPKTWEELKRQSAEEALRITGGRITPAAKLLGINRETLRRYRDSWKIADCRKNPQPQSAQCE